MGHTKKDKGESSPFFASTTANRDTSRPVTATTPLGKKQLAGPQKATEIGASDEGESDDGFSDDSLEDLSTLLGQRKPEDAALPRMSSNDRNATHTTPNAKRSAPQFHSSPLAIIPKHKFDLKALAKHARKDTATQASSARVEEARLASSDRERAPTPRETASTSTIKGIVDAEGTQDAQKVLRAVQRADSDRAHMRYLFFNADYSAPEPCKPPKEATKAPWNLLTKGDARKREQNLTSGVPYTILQKQGSLPDSVFRWILDELTTQRSSSVRQEYRNLITSCPEQVERLMDEDTIEKLLIRLGASSEIREPECELAVSMLEAEPYQGRDWACLESFMKLMGSCANYLSHSCVNYTVQMLLRMTMDKLVVHNMALLAVFGEAMKNLTAAISHSEWDSFCFDTCRLLKANIQPKRIQVNAVVCLPVSSRRTHDLRRRLAIGFLFNNPRLAKSYLEDVVNIPQLLELLQGDEFLIRPSTDFAELQASILLLDVAVDDGSAEVFDDDEAERQFNHDVDMLAAKLREIWRKINDSGMKLARTEAKSVVEWVQQRLSHTVRTRRVQRKSIFDLPGQETQQNLPKQQEFMKMFFKKEPKDIAIDGDTIVVKGG